MKNRKNFQFLAKGTRSFVFLTKINSNKNKKTENSRNSKTGKKTENSNKIRNIRNKKRVITVIIKKPRKNSEARIIHEAEILKLVNKYKIGPKLLETKSKSQQGKIQQYKSQQSKYLLCMEYIKGITIKEFLETEKDSKKIKQIIRQILAQCRQLDKLKLSKEEMSNPYKHILLNRQRAHPRCAQQGRDKNKTVLKPVFIDFEKSHFTQKPKNVTQFFQYLMRYKLMPLNKSTITALKKYKNSQTDKNFRKLTLLAYSNGH